jgi:chloramphenicol-sensitive protein RarD
VLVLGRLPHIRAIIATRKSLGALALSTLLISTNWGIFIWAVQAGRIVETSLAYYINPIFSILLGIFLLGERITRLRAGALGLAAAGVVVQAMALGGLPWISLVLASSFALYGYVRKVVDASALDGLFIETMLAMPLALAYLFFLGTHHALAFGNGPSWQSLLLIGAGPVTAIPLWLFSVGARSIRLSTIGFLQYIAPSISLALAVFAYGERFTLMHGLSFALIWLALALVSAEALRRASMR